MSTTAPPPQGWVDRHLSIYPLDPVDPVLIGFSGGADSVALTLLLLQRLDSDRVVLAHFSHGIRSRDDGVKELEFVNRFATQRGLKVRTGSLREGELVEVARREGRSIEELARLHRFRFFEKIAAPIPGAVVFLGHHRDDQLETLLMRYLGGSGIDGLVGMVPVRGRYHRPLLGCNKSDILSFLNDDGVEFLVDPSNSSMKHLRNRVRAELLPAVARVFPGYRGSIERVGDTMLELRGYVDSEMARILPWEEHSLDSFSIPARHFWGAPEFLRRRSLLRLANITCPEQRRIPHGTFGCMGSPSISRGEIVILRAFGYRLRQAADVIYWEKDVAFSGHWGYLVEVREGASWIGGGKFFTLHRGYATKANPGGSEIDISLEDTHPPVVIRSRRVGDVVQLGVGRKSLKKVFNELGISQLHRGDVLVVEDRMGILGFIGEPWGFPNRFYRGTLPARGSCDAVWKIKWHRMEQVDGES